MVAELCEVMAYNKAPKAPPRLPSYSCLSTQNAYLPQISIEEGFIAAIVCLCIEESRVSGKVVDLEPHWKTFNC